MKAAELCDLEIPETYLLDCGGKEPLIVSRRFDRPLEGGDRLVSGRVRPRRLHQEDFCQALGVTTALKYEPTGADFLGNMAHCIASSCSDAFGERLVLLESVVFSYLVGNCDNHLKNYSLLYDSPMTGCAVSPTYDVTSTTCYPELSREMGVFWAASGRILRHGRPTAPASWLGKLRRLVHPAPVERPIHAGIAHVVRRAPLADALLAANHRRGSSPTAASAPSSTPGRRGA